MDLLAIYLETLERCHPGRLAAARVDPSMPRNAVAIGKCAGLLLDGVASALPLDHAFVALPEGYPLPRTTAEVRVGGHPRVTAASFDAGRALLEFVGRHDDILFLVSGGGSACVEVAAPPFDEARLMRRNAELIAAGMPIAAINAERRKMSAIKGGRLRERVRGRCVTLVLSDVSSGALQDVASGPTVTHPGEALLIADNATLTGTAAAIAGAGAVTFGPQVECDVAEAARLLVSRALSLPRGSLLVAGGEPTVVVRGSGRGGRCSELAVRFWMEWTRATDEPPRALFASSDAVDGNSGAAGVTVTAGRGALATDSALRSLEGSDSFALAPTLGRAVMIPPTGNNLRDLFLVARD